MVWVGKLTPASVALRPAIVKKKRQLHGNAGAGVKDDIAHCSRTRGQIALVPFIETRDEARSQHRNVGPSEGPFCSCRGG